MTTYTVRSDHYSDHNLPIGATVTFLRWDEHNNVALFTQGGDGDEVAIDGRDLQPDKPAVCKHCQRGIVYEDGGWVDPEATGDDAMWRETCGDHDTFTAEHEPDPDADLPDGYRWATADETEAYERIPGAIVVPRTADSNGTPYTHDEADIAVPDERDELVDDPVCELCGTRTRDKDSHGTLMCEDCQNEDAP
jgi:hypothetical protein